MWVFGKSSVIIVSRIWKGYVSFIIMFLFEIRNSKKCYFRKIIPGIYERCKVCNNCLALFFLHDLLFDWHWPGKWEWFGERPYQFSDCKLSICKNLNQSRNALRPMLMTSQQCSLPRYTFSTLNSQKSLPAPQILTVNKSAKSVISAHSPTPQFSTLSTCMCTQYLTAPS